MSASPKPDGKAALPVSASPGRTNRLHGILERARRAPYEQDFYGLMRALENALPGKPRLGTALRPSDEPVRLGQDVELTFAPTPVSSCTEADSSGVMRLGIRFMGLFGPNGPLPLHMTEYAHDRLKHAGDRTFRAFADMFHHRMILLLYRAWAQARPALWLDRDEDARFDVYTGALFGAASAPWWRRDSIWDSAKRRHAGLLARGVKHAEGLRDILANYLGLPIQIEPYIGHWMTIQTRDRSFLGDRTPANQLGVGAVVGSAVWDRQYKFRIHVGPLSWGDYHRFLPGATGSIEIRDWVRQYTGFDLAWDLNVTLRAEEVRHARMGGSSRVGLTAWLGAGAVKTMRADLIYDPEARNMAPTTYQP
jgi:type VI secretion system protein ImpH